MPFTTRKHRTSQDYDNAVVGVLSPLQADDRALHAKLFKEARQAGLPYKRWLKAHPEHINALWAQTKWRSMTQQEELVFRLRGQL